MDCRKGFGILRFGSCCGFVVLEKVSHPLQVVRDLDVRKTFPQAFSHPGRPGMALSQNHDFILLVRYLIVWNFVDQRAERHVVFTVVALRGKGRPKDNHSKDRYKEKAVLPELWSVLKVAIACFVLTVVVTPAIMAVIVVVVLLQSTRRSGRTCPGIVVVLSVLYPSASAHEHYLLIVVVTVIIILVIFPCFFFVILYVKWVNFRVVVGHDRNTFPSILFLFFASSKNPTCCFIR
mmetsp:Transcript_7178/g.17531  ORF Transcript_7178/g.17531 Transcript_7178/m.17531 type:complete len:235 (+) Transcript_7178:1781-2485(+)